MQLSYLAARPDVAAVGGGIRTFAAADGGGRYELGSRYYSFPVEPARVRWELAFTSALRPAVSCWVVNQGQVNNRSQK